MSDWPETPVRPKHIAARLGIDPKKLRAWLRHVRPRHESEKATPWELTPDEADALMARWRAEQA